LDGLTIFEYSARSGRLSRVDPRAKLAGMLLLSMVLLSAGWTALALASLLTGLYILRDFEWMGRLWHGLRWLAPLLALMAAARAFTEPAGPFLDLGPTRLSIPGLVQGSLFAWRLMLMVLLGSILTATTSPSGVKAAVTWFLKPFPLVPAARIGTMLSLLLRFIPLIFQQAGQTLEAQRARAVERRKNPFYRLRCFGLPFLRRTLLTADRMTEAMEARCYSDRRTGPQLTFTAGDGLFAGGVTALAGLILWL